MCLYVCMCVCTHTYNTFLFFRVKTLILYSLHVRRVTFSLRKFVGGNFVSPSEDLSFTTFELPREVTTKEKKILLPPV